MNFRYTSLIVVITLVFTSFMVSARDRESGVYLTGLLGYTFFDNERGLEDDPNLGLGLGYDFSKVWSTELVVSIADLEAENTEADIDQLLGRIDALYHFNPDSNWRPFLIAGVGHNTFEDDNDNDSDETLFNAGAGIKHEISENMDLRLDARGLYSHDNESKDTALNLGFSYLFGSAKAAPLDSDGDGINDDVDQCPDTAYGQITDATGCAVDIDSDGDGVIDTEDKCPDTEAQAEVDQAGCPVLDDDGDGVANDADQCPSTPAGAPVDDKGCVPDADNDGVDDTIDTCADTPAGAKVDATGCRLALEEVVSMQLKVTFPTNSAEVTNENLAEIEGLAEFMRQYPDTTVVVEGHSDSMGDADYNQQLSERRAQAVRDVVVEQFDIDSARITSIGYGETKPIADNSTKDGRETNRRVVAVIEAITTTEQ